MKKFRNILVCLLISLLIGAILKIAENNSTYRQLDYKLYDLQMALRPVPEQNDHIVFVEMDDMAIQQLGRWPWPRNIFANIITSLDELGAKQILFDVTFAQPSPTVIDKNGITHIFKGKQDIIQFIENEKGLLPAKDIINTDEITHILEQIQSGFETFTTAADQKLKYAITDHDVTLSQALKNKDIFIGYAFEIMTGDPSEYKVDQQTVTIREKISALLEKNIEISVEDTASTLHINPEQFREEFNLVKNKHIKSKIISFLKDNPDSELKDVIFKYEIFDQKTQTFFKDNWISAKNELIASNKFPLPKKSSANYLQAVAFEPPYYKFSESVHGGGFLNGIPNSDGILRKVPLWVDYDNNLYPQIAIAAALNLLTPENTSITPGKYFTLHKARINGTIKDIKIPINQKGETYINWVGKWQNSFNHISAAKIYYLHYLKTNKDESQTAHIASVENKLRKKIKDSICIIGLTATGTHDFNPIPYESTYPMVGTHGNLLNSILTEQFLTKAENKTNTFILLALCLFLGISLACVSSISALVISSIVFLTTCTISFYLFQQGLWINLASPLLLCIFTTLGITSYKFSTEEKDKRKIKKAFAKYVAPDVIEEISNDPSKLQLGGTRRELTVLFSDIRSFTTYSEKRDPEEVVSILNEYLDAMTHIIFECKGTLDKYVGDEIMAVFGAPQFAAPEVCAKRAVITAIRMLDKLKELQAQWIKDGLEPLDIGIGINSGEMVVGNMGSDLRMDYTVIGDAVNLGARIEALTRDFDCALIIAESTYHYVKNLVEATPLEPIKVKGKEVPVMIYKITGLSTNQYSLD